MTDPDRCAIWSAELDALTAERLWTKVDKSGGPDACWPFSGAMSDRGYGHMMVAGRSHPSHRIAFLLSVGPADGLVIDHLCRNRACCNPAHLEAVTQRENLLRSPLGAGGKARRTHCPQGHEYTPENTWTSPKNQRHCKTCRRLRMARARAA